MNVRNDQSFSSELYNRSCRLGIQALHQCHQHKFQEAKFVFRSLNCESLINILSPSFLPIKTRIARSFSFRYHSADWPYRPVKLLEVNNSALWPNISVLNTHEAISERVFAIAVHLSSSEFKHNLCVCPSVCPKTLKIPTFHRDMFQILKTRGERNPE
jgi:hypothetical protein